MAEITSIELDVGRETSSIEFAELNITVRWSPREVEENMSYLLRGMLIEKDDEIDFFDMNPDGSIHWEDIGDLDDYVGLIGSDSVRPNGASVRNFRFRRAWNFGDQESESEEYVGIATIVPELRGDIAFSATVSANLG
jgi:hypothetical protein